MRNILTIFINKLKLMLARLQTLPIYGKWKSTDQKAKRIASM